MTIVRHSLSQARAKRAWGEDKTSPDAPEAESLGANFRSSARVVMPGVKLPFIFVSTVMSWKWLKANGHLQPGFPQTHAPESVQSLDQKP